MTNCSHGLPLESKCRQCVADGLATADALMGIFGFKRVEPIEIVVLGQPAPQGSKSFKGLSKGGHAILVESSKKVRPWRQDVKAAAEAVRPAAPLDCALRVRMVFTMPKPSSAPKRRQTWPMRTPDLSKLVRSTEDALTDAGVWKDDARVVEYSRVAKVFPGEDPESLASPGVRITIEVIG